MSNDAIGARPLSAYRTSQTGALTLRQAALTAGFAYLLNPVSYAEFHIYPKLVIPDHLDQTVQNIGAHPNLFAAAIVCYLVSFIGDIVLAWSLYFLLAPVNRALSRLTAWFRLIYAAMALCAIYSLVSVYRILTAPEYLTLFGSAQLNAQVKLLLGSFRWDWSLSLAVFGIHLVLLGYLICRSRHISRIVGVLLVINGLGWIVDSVGPYVLPHANLGFTFVTFFGEVVFMFWLLIMGWRLKEPPTTEVEG